MKVIFVAIAALLGAVGTIFGQEETAASVKTELVQCGSDTVAIFAGTKTRDGHYAIGWTVRPKAASAPPVDWSDYKWETQFDWLAKYPTAEPGSGKSDAAYDLVDGVLDLTAKKFVALLTADPFFPRLNHRDLWVAWSTVQNGRRYALVTNNGRFSTINLWLVSIDAKGMQAVDLAPVAGAAVRRYVKRKEPRVEDGYAVQFAAGAPSDGGNDLGDPFERNLARMKVNYDTMVPKSSRRPMFDGKVTIALPSGKVLAVDGKDEGDDSSE